MRKAQVTLFVILGLLLVFLVAFLTYTATQTQQGIAEREEAEREASQNNIQRLTQYVDSCVENRIAEATREVLESGYYEDSQGKTTQLDQGKPVLHGIIAELACADAEMQPPEYPVPNTAFNDFEEQRLYNCRTQGKLSGYVGTVDIPRLCAPDSPNNQGGVTSRKCGEGLITQQTNNTLEHHLAEAVEAEIQSCFQDEGVALNVDGNTYSLDGEPQTTVVYTEQSTVFNTRLPVQVAIRGGEPTYTFTEISHEIGFATHKYWADLFQTLQEEARKPLNDLGAAQSTTITQPCEDCPSENHALFTYTSTPRTLQGQPVETTLLIENRRPIISHYDERPNTPYDVVIEAGETHTFDPDTVDPDQGPLTHTYSGPGENTLPTFQATCQDLQSPEQVQQCTRTTTPAPTPIMSTVNPSLPQGTISTEPNNGGIITTTLTAEDQTGLHDEERIDTLVVDKPRPSFTVTDTVEPQTISLEQPFSLDASTSQLPKAYPEGFTTYDWMFKTNGPITTTTPLLALQDIAPYNIENITEVTRQALQYSSTSPSTATLETRANTQYLNNVSGETTQNLNVVECVQGTTGTPYPYGSPEAYQNSNPCCTPSNTYASTTTQCYAETHTGLTRAEAQQRIQTFQSQTNRYAPRDRWLLDDQDLNTESLTDTNNNITLQRYCSGQRGNICGGNPVVTVNT